jgi:hypothetical protein
MTTDIPRRIEDDPRVKRILAMKPLTAEDERIWNMGPIGPREDIYAVWDDGYAVYYDGNDNPLEPGWVLRILRGTDVIPARPEVVAEHPWMQARHKPKPCKRCGRETFRVEQVQARTEPLRCGGCQYVTGRCKCQPIAVTA